MHLLVAASCNNERTHHALTATHHPLYPTGWDKSTHALRSNHGRIYQHQVEKRHGEGPRERRNLVAQSSPGRRPEVVQLIDASIFRRVRGVDTIRRRLSADGRAEGKIRRMYVGRGLKTRPTRHALAQIPHALGALSGRVHYEWTDRPSKGAPER